MSDLHLRACRGDEGPLSPDRGGRKIMTCAYEHHTYCCKGASGISCVAFCGLPELAGVSQGEMNQTSVQLRTAINFRISLPPLFLPVPTLSRNVAANPAFIHAARNNQRSLLLRLRRLGTYRGRRPSFLDDLHRPGCAGCKGGVVQAGPVKSPLPSSSARCDGPGDRRGVHERS